MSDYGTAGYFWRLTAEEIDPDFEGDAADAEEVVEREMRKGPFT